MDYPQQKQPRKFNRIEYSNSIRQSNLACRRGHQTETSSLNINLHTMVKKQLLSVKHEWSPAQRKAIEAYAADKGNFLSNQRLYGPPEKPRIKIRQTMMNVYGGSQIAKRIFANDNMEFTTKIVFLKFLEKVRMSALKPEQHKAWKQK